MNEWNRQTRGSNLGKGTKEALLAKEQVWHTHSLPNLCWCFSIQTESPPRHVRWFTTGLIRSYERIYLQWMGL